MFKDSKGNETCYCEECLIKQEKIDKLKAENEELKEKINENKICYNELLKLKEFFYNKVKTFYCCLNEIEEICTHETINLTDSCVNGGRYFEILQKIKEVKEE